MWGIWNISYSVIICSSMVIISKDSKNWKTALKVLSMAKKTYPMKNCSSVSKIYHIYSLFTSHFLFFKNIWLAYIWQSIRVSKYYFCTVIYLLLSFYIIDWLYNIVGEVPILLTSVLPLFPSPVHLLLINMYSVSTITSL